MTTVYMLHLVDRYVIGLLLQPIKEDLRLSDTQLGYLTGIAFGLFYATLGVPIARLADRSNRVTIISVAIGLWSLTVMACLMVTSYLQLLVARIAASVGEAGCKPPTYSLVGDYFVNPAERTRAMTIYIAGSSLSELFSFVAAGWLNELYGWRITLFLIGIPGLMLAVLVKLTITEPRTQATRPQDAVQGTTALAVLLVSLWRQRSFRQLTFALMLVYVMGTGFYPWYAAFMIRSHGMSTGMLGVWLGLIFGIGGIVGILLGGYVASRWFSGDERGQMRMSAITVALLVPFFVAFLTLQNKYQALFALMPLITLFSMFLGPTYALMQRLVTDDTRATSLAVVMLLANLLGFGVGPLLVGTLSDILTPRLGGNSLRYAMLVMSLVAFWASYHFWQAGRTVKQDLAAVEGRRQFDIDPEAFANVPT
jgi:predicted MFS family arabinose efflux permease